MGAPAGAAGVNRFDRLVLAACCRASPVALSGVSLARERNLEEFKEEDKK